MSDLSEVLTLVKGSVKPFDVYLFNENDSPESLAGADEATFTVKDGPSSAASILTRSRAGGTLTIDVANSKLTMTLSQGEADGLTPGEYIGDLAIRFGSGNWFHADLIRVRITPSFAAHSPA